MGLSGFEYLSVTGPLCVQPVTFATLAVLLYERLVGYECRSQTLNRSMAEAARS